MRRKYIALFTSFLFLLLYMSHATPLNIATTLKDYYMYHFTLETGAINAVTALYLDYRIFDTLFESLLLLISVIAVIYFSRHEGDY